MVSVVYGCFWSFTFNKDLHYRWTHFLSLGYKHFFLFIAYFQSRCHQKWMFFFLEMKEKFATLVFEKKLRKIKKLIILFKRNFHYVFINEWMNCIPNMLSLKTLWKYWWWLGGAVGSVFTILSFDISACTF